MSKSILNFVADDLSRGVVLTAQANSLLFGLIPFTGTNGSLTHAYNVVEELTDVNFRNVNESCEAGYVEPVLKQELLKIMCGDVKVDRIFYTGIAGNVIDVQTEQTQVAVKSMMNRFETQFLYGEGSGAEFKGLYPRLAEGMGKKFSVASLDMESIDECLDYVRYSKGEVVIICNPRTRRALNKVMRTENSTITSVEQFGQSVTVYDNAKVLISEAVHDNEIFFINLDTAMGVSGLTTNGLLAKPQGFEGTFYRTGIEMLVACKTAHPRAFAVLSIGATAKARAK